METDLASLIIETTPLVPEPIVSPSQLGASAAEHVNMNGPWRIQKPGTLRLSETPFLQSPPEIPSHVDRTALAMPRAEEAPERILLSTVDLCGDWLKWSVSDSVEVRRAVEHFRSLSDSYSTV